MNKKKKITNIKHRKNKERMKKLLQASKLKAKPKKVVTIPAVEIVPEIKEDTVKISPANKPAAKKKTAKKKHIFSARRKDITTSPSSGMKPYKRKRGEIYMSKPQLKYFKNILEIWKNELINEGNRTVHHMQDESSNFPDPNDRATQESEFGLVLRTRDRDRKLLNKIQKALQRIDEREYGFCEETGEEIGLKRLHARPVATLSLEAQERRELAERQYRNRNTGYR